MTMESKSVIVIGAGIGGLTAAIHLARIGLHVTVLEKNSRPGGRCDRFSRSGHHFDTGPTLFVMPLLYEAEFRALGVSMHEQLDLQRVDPTYHLVFDDGSQLAAIIGPELDIGVGEMAMNGPHRDVQPRDPRDLRLDEEPVSHKRPAAHLHLLEPGGDYWLGQRVSRGIDAVPGEDWETGPTVVIECTPLPFKARAKYYRDGIDIGEITAIIMASFPAATRWSSRPARRSR